MAKNNHKSEKLLPHEKAELREFKKSFNTQMDFARAFNIDRVTLLRITKEGSGVPANIYKIRQVLKDSPKPSTT